MKRSRPFPWLLNLGLLLAALVLSVAVGSVAIPPGALGRLLWWKALGTLPAATPWKTYAVILFDLRLPHALLIAVTGAALAGSGAAYQGLFRNPLADPFLLGVASGAGLGAVAAMSLRWPSTLGGMFAVPAAAFLGALLTVVLVYQLARVNHVLPISTLILAGVAVNALASALTSFLMLRSQSELRRAIAWLMGGSALSGWEPLWAVLPYVALGLGILLTSGHALNVLQFGEEQAQQLGLRVEQVKWLLIGAASLATAAAVAFSGIIGFIGLMVPHGMRMLWGNDHRHLLPLSTLGGAWALLLADLLARTLIAPQVLPVGIITALAGAPFFLLILRRTRSQVYF